MTLVISFGYHELVDLAVGMAAFDPLEPYPGAQDLPAARSHAAALGLALELDQTRGTERAQARPQVRQHRGREIEIPDEGEQPPVDFAVLKSLEKLPDARLLRSRRKHDKGDAVGQVGRIRPIIVGQDDDGRPFPRPHAVVREETRTAARMTDTQSSLYEFHLESERIVRSAAGLQYHRFEFRLIGFCFEQRALEQAQIPQGKITGPHRKTGSAE